MSALAPLLAARGYAVTICGPATYAGIDGVGHVELDMVRSIDPARDARDARRLAAVVRGLRPGIVHAHSSKAGALARIGRPLAWSSRVIYTPHGFAFAGHFDSERQRSLYRGAERALGPLAARTLCVCEAERRLACQVGPGRRTRVVHNGVPAFVPGPAHSVVERLAERGPVVGTVVGLRPGKGAETFVEAAALVLGTRPDASFVIAGDGPTRGAIERSITEHGLEGRVVLLGHVEGSEPLLRATTVAVNPSWAESFPYSVLESMAAGLPVVATAVGGTAEAIEDRRSGVLVAPRDPRALADAIAALLDDPARARMLGAAAAARAGSAFTLDAMADGVAGVYAEVAPGAPPPR